MSSRTTFRPKSVITAGDMSANLTSLVTILQSITCVGYSLSWTGTAPVGTASVQVSNDYSLLANGRVNNSGTWTTLELSLAGAPVTSIPITGSPGTAFIEIDKTSAYAIRLIYTFTSGVGSLDVIVNGKVS